MTIDLSKHKDAFMSEAKAHIYAMNQALVGLEKHPSDTKYFQEIFRAFHTLKSISGAMGYFQSMNLCHEVEGVLDTYRNDPKKISQLSDLLFKCLDYLSANLKLIEANEVEMDSSVLIQQILAVLNDTNPQDKKITPLVTPEPVEAIEKISTIEVKVSRLDTLMNLAEELLVTKLRFDTIRDQIESPELTPAVESLGRLISELQYHVMQIRLVPIGFIFNRFQRMVRDIAKIEKKEVRLEMEGEDIELDRVLIDQIGESLAHLIRNAIDHGLESPKVRIKNHKPAEGVIKLRASRTRETAVIDVSDDGAGLDLQTLKQLGLKNHILRSNATENEIKEVIFSGLSTKKVVTEISGRGLGLPIVKQKIESIGGVIHISSEKNVGTTFTIEIPLSLAIIKTLFVKISSEIYAIPIEAVERLLMLEAEDFKGLMNSEAIVFEGESIPIIRMEDLFDRKQSKPKRQPVVIIRRGNDRLGLAVDSLLSTQEIVIKPLSLSVRKNKYFSGAAVVGSGLMVLIIDVAYLMRNRKA